MAFLIEGANARHEHEWKLWETEKLPDDKVLIPGVIDSTSNTI
jgi:5-methyltetrahydropteroyltriglutamate--homocysteine methyltransferase